MPTKTKSVIDTIISEVTNGPLSEHLTIRGTYRFTGEQHDHVRCEDKQGIYTFISSLDDLEAVRDIFGVKEQI